MYNVAYSICDVMPFLYWFGGFP